MLKDILPNRWFVWAISSIIFVFIFVFGQIKLYAAEVDYDEVLISASYEYIPLGSQVWNSRDKGKVYKNDKRDINTEGGYVLSEAVYPKRWISKVEGSNVYFSNRSHQCVLAVTDVEPSVSKYLPMDEKTFTGKDGDIKLAIFRNNNIADNQKYLVQPTGSVAQKEGNVFGLIRVEESEMCVDTFAKIISTFKFEINK